MWRVAVFARRVTSATAPRPRTRSYTCHFDTSRGPRVAWTQCVTVTQAGEALGAWR